MEYYARISNTHEHSLEMYAGSQSISLAPDQHPTSQQKIKLIVW